MALGKNKADMHVIGNGILTLTIGACGTAHKPEYYVQAVELQTPRGQRRILEGKPGREFVTSHGGINAQACEVRKTAEGGWTAVLSGKADGWEARETISLAPDQPYLRREQTYRFTRDSEAAIHPGFLVKAEPQLRYTFPLRAWEQPLAGLKPLRAAVDWALPFPFHVWHDEVFVALYGVEKSVSPGTLDFTPPDIDGKAGMRVYYPDTDKRVEAMGSPGLGCPTIPGLAKFAAGAEVTLVEIVAVKLLAAGEEPLLEAERIAAGILMRAPPQTADLPAVAQVIADFYKRCELWEPDALGKGRGWFSNMWVRTQAGLAKKRGEMSGYFDLGWGEGIAVEMWMGAVRHWKRTGDRGLLAYVDEMTRNMDFFKRGVGADAPYFDRADGKKYGDFLMDHVPGGRIWTHSLGHTGNQLIQLCQLAPDYPRAETRKQWLAAAVSIGNFFGKRQKPNGDLQDIFDDNDQEANLKPHRITARAVVCGLWARLAQIAGDKAWLDRALRLAKAVAQEIDRYEYFNQMLDGLIFPSQEYTDGEAAYYVLEGLVPLYAATRDAAVLGLCRKAAAFGIAWTYFYDLPKAHHGVARGGQCCRMDDFPLLYPIGPAKAMEPFLSLAAATGDAFFTKMAEEFAAFIGNWQIHAPGQPWDGGMIHALAQYSGRHWGPDQAGQVDSGMATGNSLAAIEAWMAHKRKEAKIDNTEQGDTDAL